MPRRYVVYGTTADFASIRPDESDLFSFDFSGPARGATPVSVSVVAALAPDSPQPDPDATTRVLRPAGVAGAVVSALCGTFVNGATYELTASATLGTGQVFATTASVECTLAPLPAESGPTPAQFRLDFPAFRSPRDYPDETIEFWVAVVTNQMTLDPNRWAENLLLGQELFVAHMLTLERNNQLVTARGRAAMATGGAVSRSVGGVNVAYDLSGAYSDGAGFWNLSSYGQRFWYMLNQAGMGPVQA
jgi:Protein of unknown function (DUF4054)